MKKFSLILISFILIFTLTAGAEETKTVTFPGEAYTYNYFFENAEDVLTSDFLIKPVGTTLLNISFKSTTVDHVVNLKLINKTTDEILYDEPVNFLTPYKDSDVIYPSYIVIYPAELKVDNEYYIELSNPTVANAQGEIEISGDLTMLTDLAKLNNMDIAKDVGNGPYQSVTRGEMAEILAQAMRMTGSQFNCTFPDVPKDHIYYNSIGLAQQMNIAKGYIDGTFKPDSAITYNEAVKMIVCMLGYEPKALSDGYPNGYLTVANEVGLILYPGAEDRIATLNDIAEILYKAIDTPLMLQTSFGSNPEYTVFDGNGNELQTVKTRYLGIK